eukprot:scaffold14248_cov143-Isochrysis_galbana.AAC.2
MDRIWIWSRDDSITRMRKTRRAMAQRSPSLAWPVLQHGYSCRACACACACARWRSHSHRLDGHRESRMAGGPPALCVLRLEQSGAMPPP